MNLLVRCALCAATILATLIIGLTVNAQTSLAKWERFDFAKQAIRTAELEKLDVSDLALLRGIVFGRHGRVFKEQSVQTFLEKKPWYKPNKKFRNSVLNGVERANLDRIRLAEAAKHYRVEPGDLRLYEKKLIPEDMIGEYTATEWRILVAEIEAIHGKQFPDEPWLQGYFTERYWYKADPNYDAATLTDIERQNITAITAKRNAGRNLAVSPGDMDKFQNALLRKEQLAGLTLDELRTMRNEFWARRGRKFQTPGFRALYEWQDWYKPTKDQKTVKLSDIEQQNVDLIAARENEIRQWLATEPVTAETLGGLFTEDLRLLRNEIYARRGKAFKTKDLKEYFEAQEWYKPDPNFNEAMLSKIEQANLKVIAEVEKQAVSKFEEVEG